LVMEGAVFDVDGTLVDLFDMHLRAFQRVLREDCGLVFERKDLERGYGRTGEEILREFFSRHPGFDVDFRRLAEKRREMAADSIGFCSVLPGVEGLLEGLKGEGVVLGVGTSNTRKMGQAILRSLGLEGFFDAESFREDVEKGKPHPDIFLDAAGKLGVAPGKCAVFEDSTYGVMAGKAAGMPVIAVATGVHSRGELYTLNPDILVESLEQVSAQDVLSLLA
jgi:beta-phosphoglucomutase